jgi:hypothetical protein
VNPWKCPNDTYDYSQPFSGRCSPDGSNVSGQYSRFTSYGDKHNVAYYANSPEDDIFEIVPSTAIKGLDYASGIALKDKESGAIYMTGSGRDIWGYNDDFNYMSEPVDGDHTVIVHAGSISSPEWHDGSKSGIMFRSTLAPNSAHYSLLLKGNGYVCPSSRKTTGSHTSGWDCVNVGAPEAWLKVEKRMSTYTSYVGTQEVDDGPITWTVVHTKELPGIGDSYNVGLAVKSSRSWSKAQEVIFTDYEVDAYYFPSAAPSTSLMPTIFVPSTDIGAVGIPGTARQNDDDGAYVISASGSDIWGSSDEFHYVHFAHTGDIKAELLVDSFDYVYSWQKGGIMFRETLDAGSKHNSFYTTGSQGVSNQWRGSTNGNSGSNTNNLITTKPIWLQITKVGNVFTSAYKLEGDLEWTVHNEKTISTFADNFFVGIAVTSHRNGQLATLVAPELIIEEITAPTTTVPPARRLRKMKGSE